MRSHRSRYAQGQWIRLDGRRSVGGLERQAKVLGCWSIVDNNVDVYLHSEDEDGLMKGKWFVTRCTPVSSAKKKGEGGWIPT